MGMIVNGFIEPVTRTLPMEYAVEWSRLIELQMEGSVGLILRGRRAPRGRGGPRPGRVRARPGSRRRGRPRR